MVISRASWVSVCFRCVVRSAVVRSSGAPRLQPSLITIKWSQACTLISAYTASVCARVYWDTAEGTSTMTLSAIWSIWWQTTQKVILLLHSMREKWQRSQDFNFVLEGIKREAVLKVEMIYMIKRCIYTVLLMHISV